MKLPPELEDVGARTRILRDRVLIKPLAYMHPVLLTPGIEIQKGVVIGVGYGRRQRRRVAFKQMEGQLGRTLYFEDGAETGVIMPMKVKAGDVVEFSFRNVEIVDFDMNGFPGIGDLVMVWQSAIFRVDPDDSQSDAFMWSQSAGHDRKGNWMSGAESWQNG